MNKKEKIKNKITLQDIASTDNILLAYFRVMFNCNDRLIKSAYPKSRPKDDGTIQIKNEDFKKTIEKIKDEYKRTSDLSFLSKENNNIYGWKSFNDLKEYLNNEYFTDLSKSILNLSFKPKEPYYKIYCPKDNISSRIMTILYYEDEVVYQSIANIIAKYCFKYLSDYQGKNIFANNLDENVKKGTQVLYNNNYNFNFYLNSVPNSFASWDDYRKNVNNAIRSKRARVETDISTYFDSIIIDEFILMLKKEFSIYLDDNVKKLFKKCLYKWSGTKVKKIKNVGIPTGPYPSRFFGNLFLHDLDKYILSHKNIEYYRFMDDMRIFSKDKKKLEKILPGISLFVKGKGLNLKSSKTAFKSPEMELELETNNYFSLIESEVDNYRFTEVSSYRKKIENQIYESDFDFCFEKFKNNKNEFINTKLDGVFSQLLGKYQFNNGFFTKNPPPKKILEYIYPLIDAEIFSRFHTYINFLHYYIIHEDKKVLNKIFEYLEKFKEENYEALQIFIYNCLINVFYKMRANKKDVLNFLQDDHKLILKNNKKSEKNNNKYNFYLLAFIELYIYANDIEDKNDPLRIKLRKEMSEYNLNLLKRKDSQNKSKPQNDYENMFSELELKRKLKRKDSQNKSKPQNESKPHDKIYKDVFEKVCKIEKYNDCQNQFTKKQIEIISDKQKGRKFRKLEEEYIKKYLMDFEGFIKDLILNKNSSHELNSWKVIEQFKNEDPDCYNKEGKFLNPWIVRKIFSSCVNYKTAKYRYKSFFNNYKLNMIKKDKTKSKPTKFDLDVVLKILPR